MIVKYLNNETWGFIDNVRQATCRDFNYAEIARQYDAQYARKPNEPYYEDPCEYADGERLPDEIVLSNKAFLAICDDIPDEGINRHAENLLDITGVQNNWPAAAILLYLEDCKEYDAMLLVTNQKTFLMNDKGQTIERLV